MNKTEQDNTIIRS